MKGNSKKMEKNCVFFIDLREDWAANRPDGEKKVILKIILPELPLSLNSLALFPAREAKKGGREHVSRFSSAKNMIKKEV